MVSDSLVDRDVVDSRLRYGWRILRALKAEKYPVSLAFWARISGIGEWRFFLVTELARANGLSKGLQEMYAALGRQNIREPSVGEIRMLRPDDPIALAATKARALYGVIKVPIYFPGQQLAEVPIDGSYFYPDLIDETQSIHELATGKDAVLTKLESDSNHQDADHGEYRLFEDERGRRVLVIAGQAFIEESRSEDSVIPESLAQTLR